MGRVCGTFDATSQAQTGFHTFLFGGDKTAKGWALMFNSPQMGSSCSVQFHWRREQGERHRRHQLPEPRRGAPVAHMHTASAPLWISLIVLVQRYKVQSSQKCAYSVMHIHAFVVMSAHIGACNGAERSKSRNKFDLLAVWAKSRIQAIS